MKNLTVKNLSCRIVFYSMACVAVLALTGPAGAQEPESPRLSGSSLPREAAAGSSPQRRQPQSGAPTEGARRGDRGDHRRGRAESPRASGRREGRYRGGRGYRSLPRYRWHSSLFYPWIGWYGPWDSARGYVVDVGDHGAVDLDIKPEKAEIWIDGKYLGVADQFDGFPRYLWLEEGTHHLVVYREGLTTLKRRLKVRPGEILRLNDRMQPGEAEHPKDLFAEIQTAEGTDHQGEERSGAQRTRNDRARDQGAGRERGRDAVGSMAVRSSRLAVTVLPQDAAVYLDGRFLGTGEELERLHAALSLEPGKHRIEVSRPGYRTTTREFELSPGESTELDLELERVDP